jgi:hypothetical protein
MPKSRDRGRNRRRGTTNRSVFSSDAYLDEAIARGLAPEHRAKSDLRLRGPERIRTADFTRARGALYQAELLAQGSFILASPSVASHGPRLRLERSAERALDARRREVSPRALDNRAGDVGQPA